MKQYKIVIDNKEHLVSSQILTGKQAKTLAGITEEMEQEAKRSHREDGRGRWILCKIINKPIPDEEVPDIQEIDLLKEKDSKYFTCCI